MGKIHHYSQKVKWTGNLGKGTSSYRDYDREYEIEVPGKPTIQGSSDPSFLGDPGKYNPEDLLVASLSSCHLLWYLHLCAVNKITVTSYEDFPEGIMEENEDGSGQFAEVTLKPKVIILEETKLDLARQLHQKANNMCFIARSVNFKVMHKPEIIVN